MNKTHARITLILCLTILLAVAVVRLDRVWAADPLTGHWEAEITGDGRTAALLFDLKMTSSSEFTGTVGLSDRDDVFQIKGGKISGNNISFDAIGDWTGVLQGNDLILIRKLDYGKTQHMTAHRTTGQTPRTK